MKKTKAKSRRWRCQAIISGKRCKTPALIEDGTKAFGNEVWKVPLRVKLCLGCSRIYSTVSHGLNTMAKTDCGCTYDGPVQVLTCGEHNVAAKNLNRAQAMLIRLEMERDRYKQERDALIEWLNKHKVGGWEGVLKHD